jgi:hypothetical protein
MINQLPYSKSKIEYYSKSSIKEKVNKSNDTLLEDGSSRQLCSAKWAVILDFSPTIQTFPMIHMFAFQLVNNRFYINLF